MKKGTEKISNKKPHSKKKRIIIPIAIVLFLLISNAVATKIIYDTMFSRYDKESYLNLDEYEELIAGRTENAIAEGGYELETYFYDVPEESGIVVIVPGLHSCSDDYLYATEFFTDNGYDVLTFDPLGSGESGGKSAVGFSQELTDLETVLDYETATYGEKIYLFGHSRGGFAASAVLEENYDVAACVSVSGLNSAMEAIIGLSSKYVGKVANLNYFNLWLYQVMLFGSDRVAVKADEAINESGVPIFIAQGSSDTTALPEQYSIYSHRADIGNAVLYYSETEGRSNHTDILYSTEKGINEELFEEILEFYGEY